MTPEGLLTSFFGGLVIGVAYYVGIILSASRADLSLAPNNHSYIYYIFQKIKFAGQMEASLNFYWVFLFIFCSC